MASTADATLGETGEFGLISQLVEIFQGDEHVLVGPGDDAAVLRIKHGHVVVSTDLMVEGRHFRRDWATRLRRRAPRRRAEPLRHQRHGRHRPAPDDRPGRPGRPARRLGPGLRARLRRGVRERRRHRRRRGRHPGRPGRGRGDRASASAPSPRCCAPAPAPATCSPWSAGRAGPPGDWRSWAAASAHRACWSRPTAARSRRTPPASRRPRPVRPPSSTSPTASSPRPGTSRRPAVSRSTYAATPSRSPSRSRPWAPRSAPTRCSSSSAGGDDHALLATFPDVASVPAGWHVVGEVLEGEGVTVDGASYDGPTGWTHF